MRTTCPELVPMAIDLEGDKFGEGRPRRRMTDRESLESQIEQVKTDLSALRSGMSDVGRLRFDWKQLVAIVGGVLFIVGANWVSNEPLRTAVTNIQSEQALQKSDINGKAALTEERLLNMRKDVDRLIAAAELQKMKTDQLTNEVKDAMRRIK